MKSTAGGNAAPWPYASLPGLPGFDNAVFAPAPAGITKPEDAVPWTVAPVGATWADGRPIQIDTSADAGQAERKQRDAELVAKITSTTSAGFWRWQGSTRDLDALRQHAQRVRFPRGSSCDFETAARNFGRLESSPDDGEWFELTWEGPADDEPSGWRERIRLVEELTGLPISVDRFEALCGRVFDVRKLAAILELEPSQERVGAAPPVVEKSVLVDAPEAARLLNITLAAFRGRKQRCQIPSSAIVTTGRRVQFRRDAIENIGHKGGKR